MSGLGGLRGVSAGQDARFSDKDKKLIKELEKKGRIPKELDLKVDLRKVNMEVMKPWIAKRVTELLNGVEEDVLIEMINCYLAEFDCNPKKLYINLVPFLEKNTSLFMKELWSLLYSANQTESHMPQQFLDAEQEEMRKRIEQESIIRVQLERKRAERAAQELSERQAALPPPPALPTQNVQVKVEDQRGSDRDRVRGSRWDRDDRDRDRDRERDRERSHRDERERDRARPRAYESDRNRDDRRDDRRDRDRDRGADWDRTRGSRYDRYDRDFDRSREATDRRRQPSPNREDQQRRQDTAGGRGDGFPESKRPRSSSPSPVRDSQAAAVPKTRKVEPVVRADEKKPVVEEPSGTRGKGVSHDSARGVDDDSHSSKSKSDHKEHENKEKKKHKRSKEKKSKSKSSRRDSVSRSRSRDSGASDRRRFGSDDGGASGSDSDSELRLLRARAAAAAVPAGKV